MDEKYKMECRRQVIKKRLNNWSSLFDRIAAGKYSDTLDPEEASIIDDSLCDPTFIAVDQEHSKVREALCKENGISVEELSEPSPESDDDNSCDEVFSRNSSNSAASDCGENIPFRTLNNKGKHSSKSPKSSKCCPNTNTADRNSKFKQQQDVFHMKRKYKPNQDVPMMKSPKEIIVQSSKTPFQKHRHPNHIMSSPHTPSQNSRLGYRSISGEDKSTGNTSKPDKDYLSSDKQIHASKDLESLKTVPNLPSTKIRGNDGQESAAKVLSLSSPWRQQILNEDEVLSPTWTPKRFLLTSTPKERVATNTSSEFGHIKDQPVRHHSASELCEQYALYKAYKRRKSGKFGSLHIVSSLDEELSEANRYVPSLPPIVKNPYSIPRRFSLKKQIY